MGGKSLKFSTTSFVPSFTRASRVIIRTTVETFYTLPRPYDTQCSKDNRCYFKCITKNTLQTFNRLPLSEAYNESTEYLNMTPRTDHDKNLNSTPTTEAQDCMKECSRPSCRKVVPTTTIDVAEIPGAKDLNLVVVLPESTSLTISSIGSMGFTVYLSNILTSIGIWFGISVVGYDPFTRFRFRFMRRWVRRRKIIYMTKIMSMFFLAACFIGFSTQLILIIIGYSS